MNTQKIKTLIDKYSHDSANDVSDGNAIASKVGNLCGVLRTKQIREEIPERKKKIDLNIDSTKPIQDQIIEESGEILFFLYRILDRNNITLDEVVNDQEHKLRGKSISLEQTYKK